LRAWWRGIAVRIRDAEIMLSVLIEIFGRYRVVADRGLARQRDIAFEDLMRGTAHPDVGAIAVEGLVSRWSALLLLERPIAVVPPAWTLV
jgi:hypothetical protein